MESTSIELYDLDAIQKVMNKSLIEVLELIKQDNFPNGHTDLSGRLLWKKSEIEAYLESKRK